LASNQPNQTAGANPGERASAQPPVRGLESLDTQMLMMFVSLVSGMLALASLQGLKEQELGLCPGKDYGYLQTLSRVAVVLGAAAALYFAYLAWIQHRRNPQSGVLNWLFFANICAVAAVLIKLDMVYLHPDISVEQLEEELE
jgi:hypothetical protein